MKTKLVRPILVPQNKATWPNCIWLGRISKQLHLDTSYNDNPRSIDPIDDSMLPQQLILISLDPDEKIEVGDWFINEQIEGGIALWQHNGEIKPNSNPRKVIATSDKSVNAPFGGKDIFNFPFIPNTYIHQFIKEYNNGEIKDVRIEMEKHIDQHPDWKPSYNNPDDPPTISFWLPKLTNGFVTIIEPEKETHSDIVLDHNNFWDNPTQPEPKHNVRQIKTHTVYTEEEVEKLCYDAMKERDYIPWCVFQEWFNQNKKKSNFQN